MWQIIHDSQTYILRVIPSITNGVIYTPTRGAVKHQPNPLHLTYTMLRFLGDLGCQRALPHVLLLGLDSPSTLVHRLLYVNVHTFTEKHPGGRSM